MDKYCEYCGNTSGKEDSYGNCKSCGGKLAVRARAPIQPPSVSTSWIDHTGSSYNLNLFGERGQETFIPKPYWCYTKEWLDDWGDK